MLCSDEVAMVCGTALLESAWAKPKDSMNKTHLPNLVKGQHWHSAV
jgi:hypothetical protein